MGYSITIGNAKRGITMTRYRYDVESRKIYEVVESRMQEEINSYWEFCGITDLMRNQMISDHSDSRIKRIVRKIATFFKQKL